MLGSTEGRDAFLLFHAQAASQHWQARLLAADDGTDWPGIMALAAGRDGGIHPTN